MKTKTHIQLLSIFSAWIVSSIGLLTHAGEEHDRQISFDVAGDVRKSGRVTLNSTDTVGKLFDLIGPTEFSMTQTILVFRVQSIYHDGGGSLSGREKTIIEIKVDRSTMIKDLKLYSQDVVYMMRKMPVGR